MEEAAPFFIDHFNVTSGVVRKRLAPASTPPQVFTAHREALNALFRMPSQVVEDVTLPTVKAIDNTVVQPTVQATQSAAQFAYDSAGAAIAGTAVRGGCNSLLARFAAPRARGA